MKSSRFSFLFGPVFHFNRRFCHVFYYSIRSLFRSGDFPLSVTEMVEVSRFGSWSIESSLSRHQIPESARVTYPLVYLNGPHFTFPLPKTLCLLLFPLLQIHSLSLPAFGPPPRGSSFFTLNCTALTSVTANSFSPFGGSLLCSPLFHLPTFRPCVTSLCPPSPTPFCVL